MAVLVRGFAEARPDDLALADEDGRRTFAELDQRVNRTINALRSAGLGAGDTIAIVSGNRNEWFEMALACANAGITHVPVNWHLVGPEIAYILADSGARAILADHRFIDEVTRALADERSAGVGLRLMAAERGTAGRGTAEPGGPGAGSSTSTSSWPVPNRASRTTRASAGRCSTRRVPPATPRGYAAA